MRHLPEEASSQVITSLGFTLHESYMGATPQVICLMNGGGGRASLTPVSLWIVHLLLSHYFTQKVQVKRGRGLHTSMGTRLM